MESSNASAKFSTRFARIQLGWAVVTSAFFVYTLLVWRGIVGPADPYRPDQTALLAFVLAVQGVGPLLARRLAWLSYVLAIVALGALILATR